MRIGAGFQKCNDKIKSALIDYATIVKLMFRM